MKQFFFLGRNPLLSKEEIFAYAKARKIILKEIYFEENILILEIDQKIPIQELGGTIKSGEITFIGKEEEFQKFIDKNELIPKDKFSYAVYGNIDPSILKEKFKIERKKATLKHGRSSIVMQDERRIQNPNADFNILFLNKLEKFYFGITDQEYDYTNIKARDMSKPIRREELAISPRLSKILINLSEAKPNDNLLDPFCGVGAILSEALIKQINVYGIDKDKSAIKGAEKNLKWLKDNFHIKNTQKLENNDSRFAPNNQFDAIATETPLGILLKRKPSEKEASKIILDFESLLIPILKRLKIVKKVKAKIAITFPSINNKSPNLRKICEITGLKVVLNPIEESRLDQHIKRQILVLE